MYIQQTLEGILLNEEGKQILVSNVIVAKCQQKLYRLILHLLTQSYSALGVAPFGGVIKCWLCMTDFGLKKTKFFK